MVRTRQAPGGGTVVEIAPARLVGWVNRFAARNDGLTDLQASEVAVHLTGGNGTTAEIVVPFPPFAVGNREPIEAVLDHLAGIGCVAIVLVRAGAFSVGICQNGVVERSKTGTNYVQGRTAAGGWSQQRYARRRGNQKQAANESAADAVANLLAVGDTAPVALVTGGEAGALRAVLADRRLGALNTLPHRTFGDIPEPRRVVLDEIAARSLAVDIIVRQGPGDSQGKMQEPEPKSQEAGS